jgi:DNA-directed RNA polymerase specialized sigma24 family protein
MVVLAGELMRTRAAMEGPRARQRVELLELRFGLGLPIRAIAARWQVDPDSLHRAYAKAREDFRGCLRRVVAEHVVRTEAELEQEVLRIIALLP